MILENKQHRNLFWSLWSAIVVISSIVLFVGQDGLGELECRPKTKPVDRSSVLVLSRDGLTIRAAEAPGSEKLGNAKFGSKLTYLDEYSASTPVVTIDGIKGVWRRVSWKDGVGYVFSGYLLPPFFDPETPPSTLAEALSPWTNGGKIQVDWLRDSDLWVLQSEVWGHSRADGIAKMPTKKTPLMKSAEFFTGQDKNDPNILYGIDDGTNVITISTGKDGSVWRVRPH